MVGAGHAEGDMPTTLVTGRGYVWVMNVHLLQHIRHARNRDGAPIQHRAADGDLSFDQGYDDFKIVGIYSSPEAAQERHRASPQTAWFSGRA